MLAFIGENELSRGVVAVKDLGARSQEELPLAEAPAILAQRLFVARDSNGNSHGNADGSAAGSSVTPPRFRSHDESFAAWLLAVAILVVPTTARAQAGDADGPPPETHAASGAEGAGSLETQEPTLPEDPPRAARAAPAPHRDQRRPGGGPRTSPAEARLLRPVLRRKD
jgi:hypothetical protein